MGIFGSIVGGIIQGRSASKAADAQQDAAMAQLDLQREVYGDVKGLMKPYRKAGRRAQNALNYELGLGELPTFGGGAPKIKTIGGFADSNIAALGGGASSGNPMTDRRAANKDPYNPTGTTGGRAGPTRYSVRGKEFDSYEAAQAYAESLRNPGFEYKGFQATPGYEFQLSEGLRAIDGSAAAGGGLFSGATLKAAQGYGQGLANQEYNNFLNRLTGQAGSGQNAAAQTGAAAQNFAQGGSNALANFGNAGAAGAVGFGNAINSGIQNGIGVMQYQNALNSGGQPQNAGLFSAPWASGGFWG